MTHYNKLKMKDKIKSTVISKYKKVNYKFYRLFKIKLNINIRICQQRIKIQQFLKNKVKQYILNKLQEIKHKI